MRRIVVIATVLYAAAILGVFADVMLSRTHVLSKDGEDLATIFLHWEQFNARELRHGHLPLWNPHVFSGTPYFGGFQPALAYPPTWLGALLPTTVAINVGVALHFLLGAVGTFLWTARRRLHPAACFLAGFVFTFCGAHYLQLYRGHLPNLRTLVWAPWILLAIDGVIETAALPWVLVGTAAVALQILAGHVQETFYTALVAGGYAFVSWIRTAPRLRTALALVATYAGGAALAAVQLGAGFAAVAETSHDRLSYAFAGSFAFPPENLLTLVLPGIFGDMMTEPYWGRWTLSEMSLFVGCAAFLLALYAVVAADRERRRFALTFTIIALLLAFGSYTPLFRLLYAYVPGFASFRGTTKFTFLAMLFFAMLVAVGFDRLLQARPARWLSVVALVLGAVLVVAGVTVLASARVGAGGAWGRLLATLDLSDPSFRYYPVDRGGDFVIRTGVHAARWLLIAAATFLLLGGLLAAARRRPALVYAIAAVGCIELLAYARYTRPSFDASDRLVAAEKLGAFMRASGDDARAGNTTYAAMSAGTRDIWGDDPMVLRRYAEFIAVSQDASPDHLDTLTLRDVSRSFALLRLRYLFQRTGANMHATPSRLPELPRASLVSRWRVVADRNARLAALAAADLDARTTVLLERDPEPRPDEPPATDDQPAAPASTAVTLRDVSTDVLDVHVEAPAAAILLLGENYSSGWSATAVEPGPQAAYTIMPADHFLQAIPLARGTHHFRLQYRPRLYRWGVGVTLVSLVVYLSLVARLWLRRRG